MSETKKSTNWNVYYQSHFKHYESQQAALVAIGSILSSYENGVWNERFPYIYLGCEQGETIDSDLFDRYHYINSLEARSGNTFTIDVFIKNKEDWIFSYGSDLLQQSILAGYECNDGYLQERIARDRPGFKLNRLKYLKVDTPNQWCLDACLGYENTHCSSNLDYYHNNTSYYITIDNFLGKYQLIKSIDDPNEMAIKMAALNACELEIKKSNAARAKLIGAIVTSFLGLIGLACLLIIQSIA